MKEKTLLCWNVNGIRAVQRSGFLEWLYKESPDIICLQETKAHPDQLDDELKQPHGYYAYWNNPERKGYGGVATFSQEKPSKVDYTLPGTNFDAEGRVIITQYPEFTLFNVYFPNGKQGPERLKYKMDFYDVFFNFTEPLRKKGEKLIICGDVNTAHKETDLARPKANEKISGFLPEERTWLDKLVTNGYIDTFRHFNNEPNHYTWWDIKTGARARNVGWRIDYFFVTENLLKQLKKAFIMSDVMGSDHCPIGIILEIP